MSSYIKGAYSNMYSRYLKRLIDILCSLLALIILSPALFAIALLVRVKLGRPVIFKQKRLGRNEEIFTLYKFRTMTDELDNHGNLLSDTERLTKLGRTLRSTSIDELPELLNIFFGQMSIVGPRPLPICYLPYFTDEERTRHSVRSGLTGLAQVNGRNSITWEEKFKYDIEYTQNITFIGDLKIILQTIVKVIKKSDIGQRNDLMLIDFNVYRESQRKTENVVSMSD